VPTFLVRRAGIAGGANELDAALVRLRAHEEHAAAAGARWLHSLALHEGDGRLGLLCAFQADSAAQLRRHAALVQLPAVEILPVLRTLVLRPFAPSRVYLVRRRRAWRTAAELQRSAGAARRVADEQMANHVCWLRSDVVREDDGSIGSLCLFQAIDVQALTEHARRAGVPCDDATPVIGRVVFREEPPDGPMAMLAAARR
jgi:hypothetical protein